MKSRPAAELTAGQFDRSLDALEGRVALGAPANMSSLYALYVSRGLVSRAKQFRDTVRKNRPDYADIFYFFDRTDENPAGSLH